MTQTPAPESAPEPAAGTHQVREEADAALADCVLCGEPTEYPASTRGATYCPVCEWQEAQRTACSG
ncbi:hypothetical protein SAMN05216251_10636 [Actinacidiphila alni]|uniref:Uncharacterized protein n=1 Tax=Actinacidiphila alni TaxID=380248 RepID=A0A1I2E5T6_9ACTN|nr:hypothetical protein [Actinacidiphila alni]SFE88043.1 hypothetical protein SAMN05216251_10636 [Actinacidiphila alni]